MQNAKVNMMEHRQPRSNRLISLAFIIFVLIAAGFAASKIYAPGSTPPAVTIIPQNVLEEKYGLRVNLIAVTGAGGFVDVRIKMVDGEKAKLLLSDKKNFPALWINKKTILNAPEDTKSQKMRFDDGGTMFIMYPNSADAVKPGAPVTLLFGDLAVEPINAQ